MYTLTGKCTIMERTQETLLRGPQIIFKTMEKQAIISTAIFLRKLDINFLRDKIMVLKSVKYSFRKPRWKYDRKSSSKKSFRINIKI